jgi:hypothetical protein
MFVSGAGPVASLLSVALFTILWHISRFSVDLPITDGASDRIALLCCLCRRIYQPDANIFNMLDSPLDGSGVLEDFA